MLVNGLVLGSYFYDACILLRQKRLLQPFVLVSGIGLLFPVGSFLWNSTVTKGINVSIEQFYAIGPRLPIRVKKVTYYSNNAGTEALFKVSEQEILKEDLSI